MMPTLLLCPPPFALNRDLAQSGSYSGEGRLFRSPVMPATRTETDSIGPIEVPATAYWGAQTQRSIENFPFGPSERMPVGLIHALAIVKQAAAQVNARHNLDQKIANAIERSEEHTSELQSLMRISYAVFC